MATAASARLIRGHPPSPPQSTDGATPEPHRESMNHLYGHSDAYGLRSTDEVAYGNRHQSLAYDASPPRYVPSNDYSPGLPIRHPMLSHALQVSTPPPTSDELVPGSFESTPPHWRSSPPQQRSRPKPRPTREGGIRRKVAKQKSRYSPSLEAPLSELTAHMTHVPLGDMDKYVHRSVEKRLEEAAKKGKVARPMNSFMLYRSDYQERTKLLFAQNNHQVVSQATGRSWKIEPAEIRKKYEVLANIEKANHVKAHPGYRFAPTKDKKRSKSADNRNKISASQSPSPPDFSPPLNYNRATSSSEMGDSGWDSRGSTPFGLAEHGLPMGGYLPSFWHTSNPGRPAPGMMSPEPPQYMQQSVHPSLMGSHVEDVRFRKVDVQDAAYASSTSLAGLPGATHHELLQPQTSLPAPGTCPEGQLDPQLLGFQSGSSSPSGGGNVYGNSHYPVWQQASVGNCYLPVAASSIAPSSVSYHVVSSSYQPAMMDSREACEASHEGSMDAISGEFDHWINAQPVGY